MRGEVDNMEKTYIIIAYDGTEVIDNTPEADVRISAMDVLEERYKREQKMNRKNIQRMVKNPLLRLIRTCNLICGRG